GVDTWRVALEAVPVFPALINAATVRILRFLHAPAIQNLHFVARLKVNARVGIPRHTKFNVGLDVAMLSFADEVHRLPLGTVYQHTSSRLQRKSLRVLGVERNVPCGGPFASRPAQAGEVCAVEQ